MRTLDRPFPPRNREKRVQPNSPGPNESAQRRAMTLLLASLHNGATAILPAFRASAVRQLGFLALRTNREGWSLGLPVRAALARARLAESLLGVVSHAMGPVEAHVDQSPDETSPPPVLKSQASLFYYDLAERASVDRPSAADLSASHQPYRSIPPHSGCDRTPGIARGSHLGTRYVSAA